MEKPTPPMGRTDPIPIVTLSPETVALVRRLQEEIAYRAAGMPPSDTTKLLEDFNALPADQQQAIDASLLAVLAQETKQSIPLSERPALKEIVKMSAEDVIAVFRLRNRNMLTIHQIIVPLYNGSILSAPEEDHFRQLLGKMIDANIIERVDNDTKIIYRLLLPLSPRETAPTQDEAEIRRRIGELGLGGKMNPGRRR